MKNKATILLPNKNPRSIDMETNFPGCQDEQLYVCVCMCMYVYVCICMYMYVYACVCMCMYVYVSSPSPSSTKKNLPNRKNENPKYK